MQFHDTDHTDMLQLLKAVQQRASKAATLKAGRALAKAMAPAPKAQPKRRAVLLAKAMGRALHPQEMAARLAVAVREGRIGALQAAAAEHLLQSGAQLPDDLRTLLEGR